MTIGSLATFGYGARDIDLDLELCSVMRVNEKAIIVDTRLKPESNLILWTRDSLVGRFNDDERQRYIWRGDLLGNENYYKSGAPVKLVQENLGIQWLTRGLEGHTLILLCGCSNYLSCHRSYIYNKVRESLGGRLPEFSLGQRVDTPCGAGHIDSNVPINVQRARNRYAVNLDEYNSRRYFFLDELKAL